VTESHRAPGDCPKFGQFLTETKGSYHELPKLWAIGAGAHTGEAGEITGVREAPLFQVWMNLEVIESGGFASIAHALDADFVAGAQGYAADHAPRG
jgi:hypothetical protein